MLTSIVKRAQAMRAQGFTGFEQKLRVWTQPALPSRVLGTVADWTRDKAALMVENALLRHQRIGLKRSVKRPKMTNTDRRLRVVLARRLRAWQSALRLGITGYAFGRASATI